MLDNLKLGYGGTKSEMERLLADAQKISGVEYNIDNLSDVYSAIHVIQGQLDITGTTAKEAATTISGSFNQMKAAAKNVMGEIALGMDVGPDVYKRQLWGSGKSSKRNKKAVSEQYSWNACKACKTGRCRYDTEKCRA